MYVTRFGVIIMGFEISEEAITYAKKLIQENSNKTKDKLRLRLTIENAGCAGTKYGVQLTNELKPRDIVHKRSGLEILIPEDYHQYFDDVVVDLDTNRKFKIYLQDTDKPVTSI